MMKKKFKKFSFLIRPLLYLFDLILLFSVVYYFTNKDYLSMQFVLYQTFFWVAITYFSKFYSVYRYTHISQLLTLIFSQFLIFIPISVSYFSLFMEGELIREQFKIILTFVLLITSFKFLFYFLLIKYRLSGGNFRNVVVFGESKSARSIIDLFTNKQDFGYRFFGFFSDEETKSKRHLGSIKDGFKYVLENSIDEIYCEINSFTQDQLISIRSFSSKHQIEIKLIPENRAIYNKDFTLEYYDTIPILKPKKLPFAKIETHIIKRFFDIVFSFLICILILSWLFPILWVLVKVDSKGPFFFKQIRDGTNGDKFYCYKIRSMKVNIDSDKIQARKKDQRITKLGAILRKTSIDELPQFINVLLGDMSVVGPRPHMNIHTIKYLKEVDNYFIRNSVKPGITGLAQVNGLRGEIVNKSDIKNRVRLDIFYIENWSFFLDIKIIMQTVLNIFKGEEKAY